jgi:hypothetical protein
MKKILTVLAVFLLLPAGLAFAGCGSCPVDGAAKAASDKKACPVGCQKPCCNPEAAAAEEASHAHDHAGHSH